MDDERVAERLTTFVFSYYAEMNVDFDGDDMNDFVNNDENDFVDGDENDFVNNDRSKSKWLFQSNCCNDWKVIRSKHLHGFTNRFTLWHNCFHRLKPPR